uniref:Uncharacterized protein n=1 Tax=Rhizophora mucronata TaxID=61149 RepID=A0A2P2P7G0_RHIMU
MIFKIDFPRFYNCITVGCVVTLIPFYNYCIFLL